ncbi:hypothetical protein [Macrococcus animalis]|uniref:hypothetical protein n=1 Tax=Macrococcus animalis TaxID=3395467 RepID=UPI0039BE5C95
MVIQLILTMAKRSLKNLNGFSYIESLLVLFIVIVIILIVPVSQFDQEKYSDDEINDEIISLLNFYQTKAYESGEIIIVSFPLGSDTLYIHSEALKIRAQYKIKNGKIFEGNHLNNTEVVFKNSGVKAGGTIKYQINDNHYQIVIQIHRGRMRVEKV